VKLYRNVNDVMKTVTLQLTTRLVRQMIDS